MKATKSILIFAFVFLLTSMVQAKELIVAYVVEAKTIQSNEDAANKCVSACKLKWTGKWTVLEPGVASACEAKSSPRGVRPYKDLIRVPFIQSKKQSKRICASELKRAQWTGKWVFGTKGKKTYCSCQLAKAR